MCVYLWSIVDDVAVDSVPEQDYIHSLDEKLSLDETINCIKQISTGKAPVLMVFRYSSYVRVVRILTVRFVLWFWTSDAVHQFLKTGWMQFLSRCIKGRVPSPNPKSAHTSQWGRLAQITILCQSGHKSHKLLLLLLFIFTQSDFMLD